jgi:hypothetical protein
LFRLLKKLDFADMSFSLYFMGYADPNDVPVDPVQRQIWALSQPATVELTQFGAVCVRATHFCSNWGTENDAAQAYHNGNSEPRGFGLFVPKKNDSIHVQATLASPCPMCTRRVRALNSWASSLSNDPTTAR